MIIKLVNQRNIPKVYKNIDSKSDILLAKKRKKTASIRQLFVQWYKKIFDIINIDKVL